MADRIIPDALALCNACDAPAVDGDPRGYCPKCGLDSAQATMERARDARDTALDHITQGLDDDAVLPHEMRQRRSRAIEAQDVLDGARDCVRAAARVDGAFR